jgi:hypothetical protein
LLLSKTRCWQSLQTIDRWGLMDPGWTYCPVFQLLGSQEPPSTVAGSSQWQPTLHPPPPPISLDSWYSQGVWKEKQCL